MDDDAAVSGNEATETQLLHREWGDAWPLTRSSMFVSRRSTTMAGPEDPHVRESFRVSFQLCRPDVLDPVRAREKELNGLLGANQFGARVVDSVNQLLEAPIDGPGGGLEGDSPLGPPSGDRPRTAGVRGG